MEWIKLRDKVPKDYQRVVFYSSNNDSMFQSVWKEYIYIGCIKNGRATHWMPLPDPPTEK